jgi:ferredoxin
MFRGELAEAKRLAVEHETIRHEIGEQTGIVKGLINLGSARFCFGEFAELYEHPLTEQAVPILSGLGDRIGIADCIVSQSWTELHLGLYERAPTARFLSPEFREQMMRIEDCIECGLCKERCPYELDVPALLRRQLAEYLQMAGLES